MLIKKLGNIYSLDGDKLHSYDDKPAFISSNGTLKWFKNDKLHRENLPAVIKPDGTMEWYRNGETNSFNDKPGFIQCDKSHYTQEWFKDDYFYRDNGKPTVVQDRYGILYWNNIPRNDFPYRINVLNGKENDKV